MRRSLLLGPLVVLTGACALRPWTPSVSVAYWAEPVPDVKRFATVPAADLVARWQLPAGNPWAPYQKGTLTSSIKEMQVDTDLPDIDQLDVAADARDSARRVAAAGLPSDTMLVVDLRGAASVVFGAELSRMSALPISLVLTFNNWPADDELVPAEETLSALLAEVPKIPDAAAPITAPVFLLDSWRLAYRDDEPEDGTFDNRYALNPNDFPDVSVLRARGIKRVLYVVEALDDAEMEEDDLNDLFLHYQAAGITMAMVDLGWLESRPMVGRWDDLLVSTGYRIYARHTLLDDPMFFARARGGFGGIHAIPRGWGGASRSLGGFGS